MQKNQIMIFDKNNNEVKVGSWVRILFIDPDFIATFSRKEAKIVSAMVNEVFEVAEIIHERALLVTQPFSRTEGIALALAPEEMELVSHGNNDKLH